MDEAAAPDDPDKDFRTRYIVPEHFVWDEADRARIQYDGYSRLVRDLLPPPPAALLDAGCGDGFLAARLLDAGYDVWGVDYSDRAVGYARLLAERGTFRTYDLRRIVLETPFDRRFDAVLLVEVLEHVPPVDHRRVVEGLSRSLRPGGCIVVTVPSVYLTPINRWHYKHFSLDEVCGLLRSAGLTVAEVVCQRRLSVLWSPRLWRAVQNRYYDLRVVRRALRRLLLAYRNVADDPHRAGRYIVKAVRP